METSRNENSWVSSSATASSEELYDVPESRIADKVLSDEGRTIIECIFYSAIGGSVGMLGIIANFINIIIFYKQGFSNTVNMALFGLAISDLWCLTFVVWAAILMIPIYPLYNFPIYAEEVKYLTASWPHVIFSRITSYITVYITGERCLSIAFPLKIKQWVTKTKTATIIILIYLVNLMTVVPEWATSYLGWRFVQEKNKTLTAAIFTNNRKSIEGFSFVIHSIFSMASFFGVILFTTILVIKLMQNSHIRSELTSGHEQKGAMSDRDKRAIKMIVLIATILIICYIPGATISMTTFIVGPQFMIQGAYINMCSSMWGIAFAFQSINSSVNIFLYYRMSSKYRETFRRVFKQYINNTVS